MKPKAVLAYCREKGIKAIDLRFVDLDGNWRHITFPLSALTESAFEEGFGHEVQLDPLSRALPAHAILLPQSEANYLDPFTSQPTLILLASIQDTVMREESLLDSRCVALRAVRYLESTSIGDNVQVRACHQFRLVRSEPSDEAVNTSTNSFLVCGPEDHDFVFRCEIADIATDSGLQINRHVSGYDSCSEFYLKPSGLVEGCDDIMMTRYLVGQHAVNQHTKAVIDSLWLPSQWSILRQGEPLFAGSVHRGLSDVGLHAMAGILRHADAIAAIALSQRRMIDGYPWLRLCSSESSDSICRAAVASNNPRLRNIEFRGTLASSNPYLVHSALLMAMIDGIQNKMSPGIALETVIHGAADALAWKIGTGGSHEFNPASLKDQLASDRDFLVRGEVFSEDLIDLICARFD